MGTCLRMDVLAMGESNSHLVMVAAHQVAGALTSHWNANVAQSNHHTRRPIYTVHRVVSFSFLIIGV